VTGEPHRRDFGEAMTQTVLHAGWEGGSELGVLQPSEIGHSLYEQMWFGTVVEYHQFTYY